jgi:hypothetical protein
MAKTFDPNRVLPGTIELVRDANGNYTTKVVGLETINSLSLPEISTTAAVTKTDTDTKTATEITGDTVQKQTQMAFKTGDDNQPDTTGDMLQEATKLSRNLSDFNPDTASEQFARQAFIPRQSTFDAETEDSTENRISIKDPTEKVFGKSTVEDAQKERQTVLPDLGKELKGSAAVQRGEAEPPGFDFSFLGGDRFKQGTPFARPKEGTIDQAAANNMTQEGTAFARPDRGTIDQMAADSLGISADPSGTLAAKEAGFASGSFPGRTVADSDLEADAGTKARADIKPKDSAVKTLKDSLTSLSEISPLRIAGTAIGGVLKAITPEPSNIQKLNTSYFTDRGDGRIGGNPATDLYAGFNRTSAFGNLEEAGKKRLDRRQKTIEKKGYKAGDKFYDDTQKMKEQQKDYQRKKAATQKATQGPAGQGGASGSDSGKIVCTMMNESYGFGSFRNKIWMKFHGNIAPEYQKGYHKLFLPLVNYAKQKGITNKIIKNILEHIAVHSTIDMRQTLRGKRHTLGRLYRKVILPLCYWAGKK